MLSLLAGASALWWSGHGPSSLELARLWAGSALSALTSGFAAGLARAPAVLAGLAGLAAVPALLVAVGAVRGVVAAVRSLRGGRHARAAHHGRLPNSPLAGAWIEVAGSGTAPVALAGEIVRIGRDTDNDVVLDGRGLESFHAVIARTADAGFVVVDTSGGGPGIEVNGRRLAVAHLADGDHIALGRASITFHRAQAA